MSVCRLQGVSSAVVNFYWGLKGGVWIWQEKLGSAERNRSTYYRVIPLVSRDARHIQELWLILTLSEFDQSPR
jgi:hypothetical protein